MEDRGIWHPHRLAAGPLRIPSAGGGPSIRAVPIAAFAVLLVVTALALTAVTGALDPSLAWLVAIGVVGSATLTGNPVVGAVLKLVPDLKLTSLPATRLIGVVERFGFVVALMLGLPEVAAILLGIKALGVYSSKNNRLPATRILGTLISVSWALVCFAVFALGYPPSR